MKLLCSRYGGGLHIMMLPPPLIIFAVESITTLLPFLCIALGDRLLADGCIDTDLLSFLAVPGMGSDKNVEELLVCIRLHNCCITVPECSVQFLENWMKIIPIWQEPLQNIFVK